MTTYTLTFLGAWLSLNAVYTQHRHQRHVIKNQYKERFTTLLTDAQIPRLDAFKLHIEYNSRMDCDNLTAGSKVFVDTMKALDIIAEDNKHIYRGITIEPNTALKHNCYIITIIPVKVEKKQTKRPSVEVVVPYL